MAGACCCPQIMWSQHLVPDFELFVAAAMLHAVRKDILYKAATSDDVFRIVNGLAGRVDLDAVRWSAEVFCHRVRHTSTMEPLSPESDVL